MYRVELKVIYLNINLINRFAFLMYSVELKESSITALNPVSSSVPNVPCGVESALISKNPLQCRMFLMYRVELKERRKQVKQGG